MSFVLGKLRGDLNQNTSETESDHNLNKPVYAYAGVEFRPLHVTDEGGFSTAIKENNLQTKTAQNEKLDYEEVSVSGENFDKVITQNIGVNSHNSGASNTSLLGSSVDMEQLTTEVQHDTHSVVDQRSYQTRKKPPPMPKPYSKPKDNVNLQDGVRKKPPPIPKPYLAKKDQEPSQPTGMCMFFCVLLYHTNVLCNTRNVSQFLSCGSSFTLAILANSLQKTQKKVVRRYY